MPIDSNFPDTKLNDEAARLSALRRYEILDSPPEEPFERITQLAATVLQAPICTVSLVDADRQWFKSCVGLDVRETSRDISICTHTIQQRMPMLVPDTLLDPRFAHQPYVLGAPFIRSYLGIPLSSPDGYNVGSLCVMDSVARTYTPAQIEILKSFASLVVDELEMRRIAQIDHLTGAATRRSFTLELERAMARYSRSRSQAALLLLDIDHFKRVNDTYGHPAGDLVLKSVAGELSSSVRRGDIVGRLGGEEFGILLQVADEYPALRAAERLRAHLEALHVAHDPPLSVTASVGIAELDDSIHSPQQWLAVADRALYDATRSGRNRCCASPAGLVQPAAEQSLQAA